MSYPSQKSIQQIQSENKHFFNIAISVDCVILGFEEDQLKVLLIASDLKEFQGKFSLLGDLVKPNEDLNTAPYRVLEEKTGLKDVFLEQVHTFGDVDRHPAGRVITTAYYSLINIRDHQLQLSNHQLQWHALNDIHLLAFDHDKILLTCMEQLRSSIMEHPVVFNLLPKKFSLRELQVLYEAILGVSLDRRNFRKKIFLMNWLEDLDELETDVKHRPGKLYRYKKSA